ncbi:MAG: CinA family protein [Gammaproteobacteria bacterium]|jgi:PncC family amidohydrolase|tara:strand:- start:188 stop:685 length:498 start_codon:yes stop_codon:yes gene_type:complete
MLIDLDKILNSLGEILVDKNLKLSLCESCTGGLLSKICTDHSGSSQWFSGSFVTYSNNFKQIIGVNKKTLEKYGAVSKNVALEMSVVTLNSTRSDVCLSITGIAGPDGGSSEKPVGTVYFSCVDKYGGKIHEKCFFSGTRNEIRNLAAKKGFQIILDCVSKIKTQ